MLRELVNTWENSGFTLRLWDTGVDDLDGKSILEYELNDGDTTISSGAYFACPQTCAVDSSQCVVTLLELLTEEVHADENKEYFDYYPLLVGWQQSMRCRELRAVLKNIGL